MQPSVWWDDKGGCDTHGHTMLPEAQSPPAAHTGSQWGTNPGNSTEPAKCLSSIEQTLGELGALSPRTKWQPGKAPTIHHGSPHLSTHLDHPDESFPEIF